VRTVRGPSRGSHVRRRVAAAKEALLSVKKSDTHLIDSAVRGAPPKTLAGC